MDIIVRTDTTDELPIVRPWEERPISEARWRHNRDIMMQWAFPGHRPDEWWAYEKRMPEPARETTWLFEHGELSKAELAELMPQWRERYDHSWGENFCYNTGERWLEGAPARKAWYRLFDIPDAIIRQWNDERRRSVKVVRKLKAAAARRP